MKVCIARLYYNEKPAIQKTHPQVDAPVLYFDGRFPDFQQINGSDFSTDGSNELIDSLPNAQRFKFAGYITEKLTYLFKTAGAQGYDALLLLSCDEWIAGDWGQFCQDIEAFVKSGDTRKLLNVKFTVLSGDPRTDMQAKPRLFIDPDRFSVQDRHWMYYFDGKLLTFETTAPVADVEGIGIMHDNRIRPKERDDMMTQYQQIPQSQRDGPQIEWPTRNKRILRKMGLIA